MFSKSQRFRNAKDPGLTRNWYDKDFYPEAHILLTFSDMQTLKTLTSLNKEVRPFFLSDNSIWSFPSVSSLSDYSIWKS